MRKVLALLAPLLLGCAGPGDDGSRPVELLVATETATLDPRYSTRALDVKLTRLVHAGLVGLDQDTLEPVPLVARGLHYIDDRTLAVELRQGLRFHSGKPLDARDVCETLTALADPALGSPHRAVVRAIGACTPEGAAHLTIRLAEPRATLLTDLEVPVLRADQARLPMAQGGAVEGDRREALDGLGPYRIALWKPAELRLAPVDTGLLPMPRHALVVRTVRDENARALRLLAGRSDIAVNALSPALLRAFEAEPGITVRSRLGANVTYLLMHNERSPFNRVEVRRAMAHAIDRETIATTLFAGRAQVASWIFPPGHWARDAGLRAEPFDAQAARTVLAGRGPVTLLTSTDRARVTIARAIAQMLGDAGLEVRVMPLDLGVLLDRLDRGEYQLATLQMPELTEPNLLKWFFHPHAVPGEGGEGKNRARWRSAEAGELLDGASRTTDVAERRRLYARLARLMTDQAPVVPLWHEDHVAVLSARARSFLPSAEGRWLPVAKLP
jgi:peptide/nickel transport system substrate-binding protein